MTATEKDRVQRRMEIFRELVGRGSMTPAQATLLETTVTSTMLLERLDAELLRGLRYPGPCSAWLARLRERQRLADAVVRDFCALKGRQDPKTAHGVPEESPVSRLLKMAAEYDGDGLVMMLEVIEDWLALTGYPIDRSAEALERRQAWLQEMEQRYGERFRKALDGLRREALSKGHRPHPRRARINRTFRSSRHLTEGRMASAREIARLRVAINAERPPGVRGVPRVLVNVVLRTALLLKSIEAKMRTPPAWGAGTGLMTSDMLRVRDHIAQRLDWYMRLLDPNRPGG